MIAPMLSELSALVGHDVELLEPRAGCWILAPVDRARLRTPFWQAVRASPGAGVWGSPAAALVGFAAGVEGWSHPRRAGPPEGLYALLQGLLATGPTPVAELLDAAQAAGFSAPQLNRAARRLGVVRKKVGMSGGWTWRLPEGDGIASPNASKETTT